MALRLDTLFLRRAQFACQNQSGHRTMTSDFIREFRVLVGRTLARGGSAQDATTVIEVEFNCDRTTADRITQNRIQELAKSGFAPAIAAIAAAEKLVAATAKMIGEMPALAAAMDAAIPPRPRARFQ